MNLEDRMDLFFHGMESFMARMESLKASIESLEERHDAMSLNLKLLQHDMQEIKTNSERNGENIRAGARIAKMHLRRISALERE